MTDLASSVFDVAVIGTGMAGNAAALFASEKGFSTVQVGHSSEIIYSSGLIDLMGVFPVGEKKAWQNPFDAIDELVTAIPAHPYAKIGKATIRRAINRFLSFLDRAGLPYTIRPDRNSAVITPIGTSKLTYAVPNTMVNGVAVLEKKPPCLFVDIQNLKGYSAGLITSVLHPRWPDVRSVRIDLQESGRSGEIYTEMIARTMDKPAERQRLAKKVLPHIKNAEAVAFPAIFGMRRPDEAAGHIENLLGLPVFEIPTIPPAVPGIRLKELFEKSLNAAGVRQYLQHHVARIEGDGDNGFVLSVGGIGGGEERINTRRVILATGRFLGGGLVADRTRIRETLFNLPVAQPINRKKWHQKSFLDPRGHNINRAGLEVDENFRPLDGEGQPAMKNLYAVGSILAHQDWIRMKSGSGLAITTAFSAIESMSARQL